MNKIGTVKELESRAKEAYQAWLIAEARTGEAYSEGESTSTHEQAMGEFERAIERHAKKAA